MRSAGEAGSWELLSRPPYDWDSAIAFLRARAIPGVEIVSSDRFVRSIAFGGAHGIVAVQPAARHALRVTIRFPRPAQVPAILDRVRRVFDLEADPSVIDAHLAGDSALEPLVRTRPGLRVPGAWDGFELAVRAILGQQITVRAAVGLLGRLVALSGEAIVGVPGEREGLTHVFPGAGRVAAADLAALRIPGARANAISSLAAAMARDPDVLTIGRGLTERVTRLRRLRGIGEWTAQYIAMRELREPDAFPSGDVGLRRAIAAIEGRTYTAQELMRRAERWRPWRAYAAQHLWSALAAAPARSGSAPLAG